MSSPTRTDFESERNAVAYTDSRTKLHSKDTQGIFLSGKISK